MSQSKLTAASVLAPLRYPIAAIVVCLVLLYALIVVATMTLLYPFIVLFWGQNNFRKIAIKVADVGWLFFPFFLEKFCKCEFHFSGDKLPPFENAIVISNHRWFLDWAMILSLAARKGRLGCCKFFAKNTVKLIPGVGWAIYMLDSIFLSRNWLKDAQSIEETFRNLKESSLPFWIISHVEGTRFSPEKLKQSQEFSKKNDFQILNNVLVPRRKGFVATVQALEGTATAIYDFTIVYNRGLKGPSVSSILFREGQHIHIHTRRYLMKDLPKAEEELSLWCVDRWTEKDKLVDHLIQNGTFPNEYEEPLLHLPVNLS